MSDADRDAASEQQTINRPRPRVSAGRGGRGGFALGHWKLLIAGVFLLGLLAQLVLATLLRLWGYINPEEFTPLVVKLLTIYSAPAGVILGGIYAARQATRKAAAGQVWAGLILSCIWNGLLLGRYLLITFKPEGDSLQDLASFQDAVLPAGSFLISAALAYLYGVHKT